MKRPFATLYFDDASARAVHVTRGAAASHEGAVRATVVRIFLGEHVRALIVDRAEGIVLYTIRKTGDKLQVLYGDATHDATAGLKSVPKKAANQ